MWNTGWGGAAINYNAVLGEPFKVEGFIPGNNNISVSVVGKGNNKDIKENVTIIPFPKTGEAPMIIAVDEKQNWMNERQSIPSGWWFEED